MKPRRNPFLRRSALAAFTLAASASSVFASDATWSNTTYSGLNVSTGANWVGAAAPGAVTPSTTNTDVATFNNAGSQAIAITAGYNLGGFTFASTGSTPNSYVFITAAPTITNSGTIQTDSTYRGIANFSAGLIAAGNATLTSNGLANSSLITSTLTNTASTTSTITLNGSNVGFNNFYGSQIAGIISQGTGSTLTLTKSGTGSWYLAGTNTYTGGTNLNGGTLIVNNTTALGSSGTITVQGNTTLRTMTALTDPSARITINDLATLTLDTANASAQTWAGLLGNSGGSNTAGLTKTGLGNLLIQPAAGAVQSWKGATTVNMGTLTITGASQTAGFTNLVNSSSALVLGGGNINFTGKVGFTNSQTFAGTTLNAGISGFIPAASTGTNTFDFGAITRNTGALLDVQNVGGYTIKAGSMGNDAGGLVRGVFYGGDFATSTGGTLGAVSYTTQNAAGSWTSATANYVTGAAVTGSVGTATINSLKLNFSGSQSFAITGALSVNDGILFGSSIGNNVSTISGGILTGPSGGGDLIIVNNNGQNQTGRNTISSVIKDYATSDFAGAGTNGVTNLILYSRAQNGALVISGANTYTGNTYIGGGANAQTGNMLTIVGVASGASIGSTGKTVYVTGGTGGSTNILQVGNSDIFGDVKGTIQLDNGKLSLKRTDTYTLSADVSGVGGGGYISQDSTGGNATINFASGNNVFTSLANAAAGTLNLTGVGSVNSFTTSLSGFNASSTTNFNSGTYYFGATGSGATSPGTLVINGATVVASSGRGFMAQGGTLTLNSGTFQMNGNPMNSEGQTAANITYNINGGNFITTQNGNSGGTVSWGIGAGTAAATGSTIANQSGGEVSVGVPENANSATNQSTNLQIGVLAATHVSTYNLSGGVLRVVGGIATTGAVTSGSSNFNWTGGRLTTLSYNGTNLTSNDGVNSGTGTLYQGGSSSIMAPGETYRGTLYTGKTAITGNYQIDAGAVTVGIGGTTAATVFHNTSTGTYDNISVSGSTVLGGRLNVALNNSYTPPNNTTQLYNILVGSASGVTGSFTNQQTATSGNSRVVLADGLSSFLIAINNTASAATTGGLTSVGARTVALGGYQAGNTYSGAGTAWDTASAAAWTNFDAGATTTPATQASGAIAQFADGTASTGAIGVSLNSTRNIQGIQFSSTAGSRAYTISNAGSGAVILDNTANSTSATIADSSTSGTANAISVPITLSSNLVVSVTNAANNLTIGGAIGGIGKSLTKTGLGTLTLNGTNIYSGLTTVTGGALNIGSSGSLASGNALTVGSSGTADFQNAGQTLGAVSNANTATNALNFSASSGTVTLASLSGAGNTRFGSNGTISTGGISSGTVNAVGLLTSDISGGTVGAGSLSAGTVSGGTNAITGTTGITTLSGGATTAGGVATIGTMSAGTANLNAATSAITTLNGGTVNLGSSTVLSVSGGTSSGAITGTGGSLTKTGGGTLTLNGTNTYSGATLISGGTLALGSAGSIDNTSSLSLGTAGTFDVTAKSLGYTVGTLTGSGNVLGSLTVSTQLAIGNSPGTTSFSSNLTLGASSTYLYDVQSGTTNADLGNVGGALAITPGAILDLVQLGTYTANEKFTLFGYNSISGTFKDTLGNVLVDGATFTDAGGIWKIDYNDTVGLNGGVGLTSTSFVTITAVPEPDAATLIGGLGMLCLLRRRR